MSEPVDPREQFGEHAEWDALAVGWALSALDPQDEDRFADHLSGCARCTATVRESLYTVADLAYALPDEAPPPSLKARLMAAVSGQHADAAPGTSGAPEPPGTAVGEPPAPVEPVAGPDEWPLGEPDPGTPGDGIDWFAKPRRPTPRLPARPTAADRGTAEAGPPRAGADDAQAGRQAPGDVREPGTEAEAGQPRPHEHDVRQPGVGDVQAAEPAPGAGVAQAGDIEADRVGAATWEPGDVPAERSAADTAFGLELIAPSADSDPPPAAGYRGGDIATATRPEEHDADVVPLAPRRRRLARRIGVGVAAAAVLALVAGLLVSNVRLRDQQADLRRVVAQREAAIQELTANEPARVAALTADGRPSPERQATLVVRGDQIEIIIESLGATTGGETYWLWTLRCDTPQPTDLKPIRGFTVTQSEFSVRDIGSDPDAASAPCFAISSELGTATPKTPRQVVAVGQPR